MWVSLRRTVTQEVGKEVDVLRNLGAAASFRLQSSDLVVEDFVDGLRRRSCRCEQIGGVSVVGNDVVDRAPGSRLSGLVQPHSGDHSAEIWAPDTLNKPHIARD